MDNNVFPLPFTAHVIFALLAFVLFVFQYSRHRRTYQLLMAAAVPATLLLYLNKSSAWHYMIGFLEIGLLAACIVTSVIDKVRAKRASGAKSGDNAEQSGEDAQ